MSYCTLLSVFNQVTNVFFLNLGRFLWWHGQWPWQHATPNDAAEPAANVATTTGQYGRPDGPRQHGRAYADGPTAASTPHADSPRQSCWTPSAKSGKPQLGRRKTEIIKLNHLVDILYKDQHFLSPILSLNYLVI